MVAEPEPTNGNGTIKSLAARWLFGQEFNNVLLFLLLVVSVLGIWKGLLWLESHDAQVESRHREERTQADSSHREERTETRKDFLESLRRFEK